MKVSKQHSVLVSFFENTRRGPTRALLAVGNVNGNGCSVDLHIAVVRASVVNFLNLFLNHEGDQERSKCVAEPGENLTRLRLLRTPLLHLPSVTSDSFGGSNFGSFDNVGVLAECI